MKNVGNKKKLHLWVSWQGPVILFSEFMHDLIDAFL